MEFSETSKFKTKTIFTNRPDKQLAGVFPVAIDLGYSGVKIFSPNKVAIFPYSAKPYIHKGTIGTLPDDYIIYTDLDTDEKWLVGNMAQTDININESAESDDSAYGRMRWYAPECRPIARTGLGIAIMTNKYAEIGNRKIVLQTGLPPAYAADAPIAREFLSGNHHFSIQIGSKAPIEFNFTIDPSDIHIMMQPMGTLYSAAITKEHRFTESSNGYMSKNVIVFDAGFKTLDFFLLRNHNVEGSETFSNLGMKQVFQETVNSIYNKFGVKISIQEMQKYLETGCIRKYDRKTFSTTDEPFADLLNEASDKVCNAAIEKLAQIYPLDEMDYLIVTGGTGAAWENKIRNTFKNMTNLKIVAGNQNETSLPFVFANVRGYYMYRYSVLERSINKKEG